jgi:hypothetical protein
VLLAAPPDDARAPGTSLLVRVLALALPAAAEISGRAGKGGAFAPMRGAPTPGAPTPDAATGEDASPRSAVPAPPTGATDPKAEAAIPRPMHAVPAMPGPAEPVRDGLSRSPVQDENAPAEKAAREAARPAPRRLGVAAMQPPLPAVPGEGELVGPVVTRTAAGVVIQTPQHTIAIEGLDVPEGALVRFLLLEPPAVAAPARASRRAPWSALGETLRTLESTAPEAAARLAADLQPHDPPRLAATIRFIAAALRDDALPFPGKAVEEAMQNAGRGDLVPVLREEMRTLGRMTAEPTQQWHVLPLPLHDGAQLTPAFLYVERDARRGQQGDEEARRFVLDVQTRALGRLQLDGLLRPRRFDLLLRSRVPLDKVMRGEIEHLFRVALDSAGWNGEIAFSTTPAFTDEPAGKYRERVAALA